MNLKTVANEMCFICGNQSDFVIDARATLLREAACRSCGAAIRSSDLARKLAEVVLGRSAPVPACAAAMAAGRVRILEAQSSGPLHAALSSIPHYTSFEYLDDIPPGESRDGVRCDDLQDLSFPDESFDIVISQEVLEHVASPSAALAEINRVLRLGGSHIFTVPLHEDRPTQGRAGLPRVYHGDPLRQEGALVRTDWGSDIGGIIDAYGMQTQIDCLHRFVAPQEITDLNHCDPAAFTTPALYRFSYNSTVVVSKKIQRHISPPRRPGIRLLRLGPATVTAGQKFNLQPDGTSAIWVMGENVSPGSLLVIDGVELGSVCDPESGTVTASVPDWIYQGAKMVPVRLKDGATGRLSNPAPWVVAAPPASAPADPAVADASLRLELYRLQKAVHRLQREIRSG